MMDMDLFIIRLEEADECMFLVFMKPTTDSEPSK